MCSCAAGFSGHDCSLQLDSCDEGPSGALQTGGLRGRYYNDRSFGAKWITDLEVSYKLLDSVTVAAGANNLFNEYPDKNGIYNAALGSGQFPGTSPFGFTGGSWYARVQYNF